MDSNSLALVIIVENRKVLNMKQFIAFQILKKNKELPVFRTFCFKIIHNNKNSSSVVFQYHLLKNLNLQKKYHGCL